MTGERVVVKTRTGERQGVVRQRWFGPVTGDSYVVDLTDTGGMVIAPVEAVRRSSESEA